MTNEKITSKGELENFELIDEINQDLFSLESALLDRDNETELGEASKIDDYLVNLDFNMNEFHYRFLKGQIDELTYHPLNSRYKSVLDQGGL